MTGSKLQSLTFSTNWLHCFEIVCCDLKNASTCALLKTVRIGTFGDASSPDFYSSGINSRMFVLGEAVRVTNVDKTRSNKGLVSMVNGDATYDIIYASSKDGDDEESSVAGTRLQSLLPVEVEFPDIANIKDAEILKSTGNSLFTLKDYDTALSYYKRSLIVLHFPGESAQKAASNSVAFTIGQGVIVSYSDSLDCQSGIISDTTDESADVMMDDNELDEETDVPFKRLTLLACGVKNVLLQRSVYLNMARCVLKQEQKGWAIKYSSVALAISHHLETVQREGSDCGDVSLSAAEVKKFLADGYYFRGKALLQAHRPKFAAQDCKRLHRYDASKAASLDAEIQTFRKNAAKSNRKLARDIASWVSTAMSNTEKGAAGRAGGAGGADLDDTDDLGVLHEEEEDEGEVEVVQKVASRMRSNSSPGQQATSPVYKRVPWESIVTIFIVLIASLFFFHSD